eukprot:208043-Alexandrium_andersonii.AAC.1
MAPGKPRRRRCRRIFRDLLLRAAQVKTATVNTSCCRRNGKSTAARAPHRAQEAESSPRERRS